ncbi:MAG: hypothetical protein V4666_11750 [Bacteroidota bacterium]
MIKNKFILMFLIFFIVVSCDQENKTQSLVLSIEAIIEETDSINTYYNTNNDIDFTHSQSFWTKVKGSKKNQKIELIFPDSVQPRQIRLDFGRNIKQNDIVINKILMSYKDKNITLQAKEIFYTFRVDESNTTFDKLNGSIQRKSPKQINGPSLYPKGDKLYKKLNQLYTEN